jgi:Ca2+-binding RTX toxin-like protein
VDTVIGGSGGDTFIISAEGSALSSGDSLQGGSGQNTLYIWDYSEDISGVSLSGIQTLEITAYVALTAAQFSQFSTIEIPDTSIFIGTIDATTGGTYDLEGKSAHAFALVAQSNAGTTVIGDDANDDSLTASASGVDTLQAGNGLDDKLFAGGGADTLIAGNGNGAALYGGAGADRFVLSNSGSATVTGGTGSNTVVFSGDEANYQFSGTLANGVITTTVTNRTTGAVDILTNVQEVQFADSGATPLALDGGVLGLISDPTVKAAVASMLRKRR